MRSISNLKNDTAMGFSYVIMCTMAIVHRCVFIKRFERIKNIVKLLTICYKLKYMIENFSEILSKEEVPDYEKLLHIFLGIKSTVERIDNEMGVFVFLITVYNFCVMMFSLYVIVDPNAFHDMYERIAVTFLALTAFGIFALMTLSASRVAETAAEVSSKVWKMPENRGRSFFSQQRFTSFVEKDITLTLWGITQIRRNFIFGMLGLIFTYTLMIHSLNQNESD
ncbi:uncharacterized protein TNCT_559961 [Trichonephila clavata]|uniref:Gustatory receptor n=1 Tax=Trichonephila clavata TaxID=2740835 RepID=A0A8X6LG39_TRICU|nr:uncharacterized protein TNCT_559961 [Trichonephila clavata]